jgi:hypothetical protein
MLGSLKTLAKYGVPAALVGFVIRTCPRRRRSALGTSLSTTPPGAWVAMWGVTVRVQL